MDEIKDVLELLAVAQQALEEGRALSVVTESIDEAIKQLTAIMQDAYKASQAQE